MSNKKITSALISVFHKEGLAPIVKKLNNLATACANAESNDFKALWYHKLIDLAKEYNMLDYVMRKVIH
jgi:hypothetical protein